MSWPSTSRNSHEQEGAKDPQAGSAAPGKDGPRVGGCLSTGDKSREQVQPRHAGNSYTLDALSPHCSTMGRSEMGGSFVSISSQMSPSLPTFGRGRNAKGGHCCPPPQWTARTATHPPRQHEVRCGPLFYRAGYSMQGAPRLELVRSRWP